MTSDDAVTSPPPPTTQSPATQSPPGEQSPTTPSPPATPGPAPTGGNLLRALDLPAGTRVLLLTSDDGPEVAALREVATERDLRLAVRAPASSADGADPVVPDGADPAVPDGLGVVADVVLVQGLPAPADRPDDVVQGLRAAVRALAPGGFAVVTAPNALGVRLLAGAADEDTGRPLDPLECYLLPGSGRAVTRGALADLLVRAGLEPVTHLGAFPDRLRPRVLLTDELLDRSPDLASHLPRFPSRDTAPRLQLADEARLWSALVHEGMGTATANAHVVLAVPVGGDRALAGTAWPSDRLGVMVTADRRPAWRTRTQVRAGADGVVLERERLHPGAPARADLRHEPPAAEPERRGRSLLECVVAAPQERPALLRAWAALVPEAEWAPVDLVPHNVVVGEGGELQVVDQEWHVRGMDRDVVLLRGLLWAAVHLALSCRFPAGERTVGALVEEMAQEIDLRVDEPLVDRMVEQEAAFQAAVNLDLGDEDERRRQAADDVRTLLGEDLAAVRGGLRFDLQWTRALDQLAHHGELLAHHARTERALTARIGELESALEATWDARLRRRWAALRAALPTGR